VSRDAGPGKLATAFSPGSWNPRAHWPADGLAKGLTDGLPQKELPAGP